MYMYHGVHVYLRNDVIVMRTFPTYTTCRACNMQTMYGKTYVTMILHAIWYIFIHVIYTLHTVHAMCKPFAINVFSI